MPRFSALLHTNNDEHRIGRTIETLRPCDEVLVIDHGSTDHTVQIAERHGASIKTSIPGVQNGAYAFDTRHPWVLCLYPGEVLSEALEAVLYEWRQREHDAASGYRLSLRAQVGSQWQSLPPELRLVNRDLLNWADVLPQDPQAELLEGDLLRYDQ